MNSKRRIDCASDGPRELSDRRSQSLFARRDRIPRLTGPFSYSIDISLARHSIPRYADQILNLYWFTKQIFIE